MTALAILLVLLFSPQADFQTSFVNGLRALNSQDLPGARASLEAAGKLDPANARVQVALAQTYWRMREPKRAADAAANAEKLGGSDPVALRTLAVFYTEQKNFAKAAEIESRCALLDSQDLSATARAMSDFLEAGEPKKAIALGLGFKGWEERPDVRNLLGKAYEADGQILKTLPELQAAIRLKPEEETYYFDLMQALLSHYNFESAIVVGEESRKRFPQSAQAAQALGVAYYGANRRSDAVDNFLTAVDLDPANESLYFFLSRLVNEVRDRRPAMERRFREYERSHPASYLGWFLHAKVLIADSREPDRAEVLLRRSISLGENYWESHYLLGTLLANRSLPAEAEKEFRRAVELNPKDPVPHYRLFRALAAQGKTEEAEAELATHRRISAEYQAERDRTTGQVKRLEIH